MEDKRIQLITPGDRKGPVFKRTQRPPDMNSLLANNVKVIKWIMALQGTLVALKMPTTLEAFTQSPFGHKQCKDLTHRELRKLASWWDFVSKFKKHLKSAHGGKVAGAAISMIQQECERANYTIISNPLTAGRAGVEGELFGEIEEFIQEHWRNLINN
jgi:hypothetical protein